MAGVNTIIRLVAAPVVMLVLLVVGWVGVQLMDPITTTLTGPPASLGWVSNSFFYGFMALGLVGLMFVVLIWLWIAPIKSDVRQDIRRP